MAYTVYSYILFVTLKTCFHWCYSIYYELKFEITYIWWHIRSNKKSFSVFGHKNINFLRLSKLTCLIFRELSKYSICFNFDPNTKFKNNAFLNFILHIKTYFLDKQYLGGGGGFTQNLWYYYSKENILEFIG